MLGPFSTAFNVLTFKAKLIFAGVLLALLIGSNVATAFVFYNKGLNVSKVQIQKYEKNIALLQAKVNKAQGEVNTRVVTQYLTNTNTIERIVYRNNDVIGNDTATRPDSINGTDNTLPVGAVYSHNQSAKGELIDPVKAGDATRSGIGDKPLLSVVGVNYGMYHQCVNQLTSLQKWVADTKSAHEKTVGAGKRSIDQ